MVKIFLSYRRDDSRAIAGRIFDRLEARFGRDCVFMDVDAIPLGTDFRKHLQQAVSQCHVFLAIIGERWLSSCDAKGMRRLESPKDFVRIEVETALAREIPVIPVLVGHNQMPAPEDLPDALQELAFRHALSVDMGADFHHHIDRLIRGIEWLASSPSGHTSLEQPAVDAPVSRGIPGTDIAPPADTSPLLEAARKIQQASAAAAQLHQQAQQAVDRCEYATAATLLEHVPEKLRNQQLYQTVVSKRDRLAELEAQISSLVDDHEFRRLTALVRQALELAPDRPDLLALRQQCPGFNLYDGTKAGERTFIDFKEFSIPFRWCPPGKFTMGSPADESNRHSNENQVDAELSQGFWMQETPVTQELFQAVLNTNPSYFKGTGLPVERVAWDTAQSFCREWTRLLREGGVLTESQLISLPTEAQWEYACRAGTRADYFFGSDAGRLDQYAWFDGNSGKHTHPVGQKQPNPWGLLDVYGNVWEWCQDWHDEKLQGGRDPIGASSGSARVVRGGEWGDFAPFCRTAYRGWIDPSARVNNTGFRVCLSTESGR